MTDWAPPPTPAWVLDLMGAVERAFEETGRATPSWPDPHPDREVAEEEYSRLTDPDRYRILDARVDAWAAVLDERGVATLQDRTLASWLPGRGPGRSAAPVEQVLVSRRVGGLGLAVVRWSTAPQRFGVDLGLVAPDDDTAVLLESIPDCGCDACDSGSADLLQQLDEWVLTAARGGIVHARATGASISRTLHGWQSSGPASEAWLDPHVPIPEGVRRWTGAPWLNTKDDERRFVPPRPL